MIDRVFKLRLSVVLLMMLSFFLFGLTVQQNRTEQGLYFVSLEFTGAQVKVGKNSMKLFIGDRKTKAPLKDKLDIEIVPWMPSHEHGMTGQANVKEIGKGVYLVEGVNLSMPGSWEIYVRINKGKKGEDTAVFNINVK